MRISITTTHRLLILVCPGDEAGTRDQRREDAHEGDAAAGVGTRYAGG